MIDEEITHTHTHTHYHHVHNKKKRKEKHNQTVRQGLRASRIASIACARVDESQRTLGRGQITCCCAGKSNGCFPPDRPPARTVGAPASLPSGVCAAKHICAHKLIIILAYGQGEEGGPGGKGLWISGYRIHCYSGAIMQVLEILLFAGLLCL